MLTANGDGRKTVRIANGATKSKGATRRTPSILDAYLARIGQTSLLTSDEEADLGRQARRGDRRARNQLIERNLRLVIPVAKKYRDRGVPFEDLIQEGNVGLVMATERFDPDKGYRFSTYAVFWIRHSLKQAVLNNGRTIRVPEHMIEKISRVKQVLGELAAELKREPTDKEIAVRLEWTVSEVRSAQEVTRVAAYLESPIGPEETGYRLGDLIEDTGAPDPFGLLASGMERKQLREAIELLPALKRQVLVRRYGLDHRDPATLAKVADELGISRSKVSKLQSEAERNLKYHRIQPNERREFSSTPTTTPRETQGVRIHERRA